MVKKTRTRRRFSPRFGRPKAIEGFSRPVTMEGLKEGRKNKLGRLEKAIASDNYMIYMRLGHYIRYEEIEGLKFRMNLSEKPASRTKQELDVEYTDLYTLACEACRETHGKCGKNATHLFYCICETQDQHCPHVYVVAPPPGMPISFFQYTTSKLKRKGIQDQLPES